jgi:DNA processing protein
MKYSNIALKILILREQGFIKSNFDFWENCFNKDSFDNLINTNFNFDESLDQLKYLSFLNDESTSIICPYDSLFPIINKNVSNKEKPYLLFYKGDIKLLNSIENNIAIIGLLNPTDETKQRENFIVEKLVQNKFNIISGLANGCDTIAHKCCIENSGKTIAILPSTLNKIAPFTNLKLANKIVETGGLLVTEYYKETQNKFEIIKRYVDRDRLQAMFSSTIILISSYKKGDGDSGSKYAFFAAKRYKLNRYVMYNEQSDNDSLQFGLNKEFLSEIDVSIWSNDLISNLLTLNSQNSKKKSFKIQELSDFLE